MSKFYGTLNDIGSSRGVATKCGYSCIKASAQSYDGSVSSTLYYDDDNNICVRVEIDDDSSTGGETYFDGYLDDFRKVLRDFKTLRNELCLQCGKYKNEHLGACEWCRWKDVQV